MENEILEIATFRLNPEIDRASFLREAATATHWLRARKGCRGRTLVEEDGQWFDLVRWASREDADAAAAEFVNAPDLANFMAALDPETIQMHHAKIVITD